MDYKECSAPSCTNISSAKSLCPAHYQQMSRGVAEFKPVRQVPVQACSFPGCTVVARTKKMCQTHYMQQLRGEPLVPRVKARGKTLIRNASGKKECCRCHQWLDEDQFYKSARSSDGFHSLCGRCCVLSQFKMTRIDYEELLELQGGRCAVCPATQSTGGKPLYVDHDHTCCPSDKSCGKCVRGLLCDGCNTALGMLGDNVERLRAAADYLERGSL